jgi:tRNA threonylcarbamoyladenosine biosynthesis protein TsaB
MKFYMLVLALDTTTRRGSAALLRHGTLLGCEIGDAARTHGQRLPGDIIRLLDRHGLNVRDIDLFAVAAGPGSFTGLRIGIATMQGLALANSRRIVGISTFDALNLAGRLALSPQPLALQSAVGAWLDAQRGEVFSALYRGDELIDGPSVGKPDDALARWTATLNLKDDVTFVGDGALTYAQVILGVLPNASILPNVPPLAPAIARLAEEAAARHEAVSPDAIRPIYVRRPDAELARDRRAPEPLIAAEPNTRSEPGTQHQAPRTTAKS